MNKNFSRAVFLDRDGTINVEKRYLHKETELEFVKGSIEAIRCLHSMGYLVIVITNQAGIAHGYYTEEDVNLLHQHIDKILSESSTCIDKYYFCPHHPNGIVDKYTQICNCRKPMPGMMRKAIAEFGINPEEAIMVGDKEQDIEAGIAAGIRTNILVRSGHNIDEMNTKADFIYDNLYAVVKDIEKGKGMVTSCS